MSAIYTVDGIITQWLQQAGAADPVATWDYAYDANNQLLGAKKTVGGALEKSYRYAYDKMGNRIFAQEDASAVSAAFNNLNQMKAQNQTDYRYAEGVLSEPAIGPVRVNGVDLPTTDGGLTFAGWTQVTSDTLSISAEDAAGNAISEQYSYTTTNDGETLAVEYDDNGNTTRVVTVAADGLSTTTRTFEWDGNDRMRTITYDDGSRTEFEYDYMGRRVLIQERVGGMMTERRTFLWDGLRIARERIEVFSDETLQTDVTKTYFPQGEDHSGDSAAEYLYTRDHLGSVREVVDAADGSLAARYDYTPWGERTQTDGAVKADFAFTGHHYHEKSGLHLAPYREYSAEMGRWLSRDLIEEGDGINVYIYCKNSPIQHVDPKGLSKKYFDKVKACLDAWNAYYSQLDEIKRLRCIKSYWNERCKKAMTEGGGSRSQYFDDGHPDPLPCELAKITDDRIDDAIAELSKRTFDIINKCRGLGGKNGKKK